MRKHKQRLSKKSAGRLFFSFRPDAQGTVSRAEVARYLQQQQLRRNRSYLKNQVALQEFVNEVHQVLQQQDKHFVTYFRELVENKQIREEAFLQQLKDLNYDVENNSQTVQIVIYDLTEESEEISFQELVKMYNQYLKKDEQEEKPQ